MRILILAVGLIFCYFPYTQIIEIESYTQPYALIVCVMGAALSFSTLTVHFPKSDAMALCALAFAGIFVFALTCLPSPGPQDFKSLLMYVSPVAFATAAFALYHERPELTERIVTVAACAWLLVGLVQTMVSPTFATGFVGQWQESAGVVADSGRGTLGLAPEPTHHGFHMMVLAATLAVMRGRNWYSVACIIAVLVFARSSSSLLALGLGSALFFGMQTKKGIAMLLLASPLYFLLGSLFESGALPESSRIVELMRTAYESPNALIMSDYSANVRVGGVVAGFGEIIDGYFLPHGLSAEAWMSQVSSILSKYPWLFSISNSGIPSGFLIIVYQLGFIGIMLLYVPVSRFIRREGPAFENWLLACVVFVFLGQYLISTPGFGALYGFILAKRARFSVPGSTVGRYSFQHQLEPDFNIMRQKRI